MKDLLKLSEIDVKRWFCEVLEEKMPKFLASSSGSCCEATTPVQVDNKT